jgi:hypothetical protein
MSAGSISLESAIRTCKVDTGWANKIESDRFLNKDNLVCPPWNGFDTTGRKISPDSFYTKSAGCNSASDRVYVENALRPQYMEYINLSANGIDANIYGDGGSKSVYGNTMPWNQVGETNNNFNYPKNMASCQKNMTGDCWDNYNNIGGQFGQQISASVYPPCGPTVSRGGNYEQAMAQEQQQMRQQQSLQEGFYANSYRQRSGF